MRVVGSGHGNGVNVLAHLVEHFPEVVELFDIGILFDGGAAPLKIDITKSDRRGVAFVTMPANDRDSPASDANAPEVNPLARWLLGIVLRPCAGEVGRDEGEPKCRRGGLGKKLAA